MSAREYRPPREMDAAMRRGPRGEPSAPIPTVVGPREAERQRRHAHRDEPSIWTRFTHSLAGRVFHR